MNPFQLSDKPLLSVVTHHTATTSGLWHKCFPDGWFSPAWVAPILSTCGISINPLPSLLANYCVSVVHPGDLSPSLLPAVDERSLKGNEPNLSRSVYTCARGIEAVLSVSALQICHWSASTGSMHRRLAGALRERDMQCTSLMQMMSDLMLTLGFPKQECQESLSMRQLWEIIYIRKYSISLCSPQFLALHKQTNQLKQVKHTYSFHESTENM